MLNEITGSEATGDGREGEGRLAAMDLERGFCQGEEFRILVLAVHGRL